MADWRCRWLSGVTVVTGVDITKVSSLKEALSTSREANLNLELRESDMRDLPWTETFDAAFCFWGSFGYFDDDGNRRFLEAVHRALKTDSRFALDVSNLAEHLLPRSQHRSWSKKGETLVLENMTYRQTESRVESEWTLITQTEFPKPRPPLYGYTDSEN